MNEAQELIILRDSPEAARYRTDIKGWVSRHGNYCGDDEVAERCARYDGCTHSECEKCGALTEKWNILCDACRLKSYDEQHAKRERKPWDGEARLYSLRLRKYFASPDEAKTALVDNQTLEDLRLVICNRWKLDDGRNLDWYKDAFKDICVLSDSFIKALEAFNEEVKKLPPAFWHISEIALDTGQGGSL